MNKPIILTGVTGAVGSATAKELAHQGEHDLILAGRNKNKVEAIKKELQSINTKIQIETVELDLSNKQSIQNATQQIKSLTPNISALINIAGIYKGKRETNADGHELMFATNHLGPFQLTLGLMDLIKASPGARVVTVSAPSTTKLNLDDLDGEKKFSAFNAFGASKMGNLLFSYRLAQEFNNTANTSIVYHPGLVKSEILTEANGFIKFLLGAMSSKPEKTGASLAKLATDKSFENANGKFFNKKLKEMKSSAYSHDSMVQQQVWDISKNLTGLN
jgi:NAD(P)-dependent dehydrogenase (short-subunit alcohol dehydrogenase family)